MPACMAHYEFGQDVLNRLDGKVGSAALAYKREFNIGLQGPDIFYFYKPYRRTGIRDYGVARHAERRAIRLLDQRKLLECCEKIIRRTGGLTMMTLPEAVPEVMTAHVQQLDLLYEKALGECPELILTALEAMGTSLRIGLGFDLTYKGIYMPFFDNNMAAFLSSIL